MKKIDWYIIRKILEKTASQQEQHLFRKWLDAAPHHREYMEKISRFDGHAPSLKDEELEKGLQEVSRIVRQRGKRRIFLRWSSVAALMALTLGLSLYLVRTDKTKIPVAAVLEHPEAVTVTLPDGKVYNLEEQKDTQWVAIKKRPQKKVSEKKQEMRIVDVPRGKNWQLTLADGTEVYLNANSRFSFPEDMISVKERRVVLEYGEVYFKVKRDTFRPFIVTAGQTETQVYGTEFNVNGYHPECPATTLVEGSVGMRWAGTKTGVRLQPGQQAFPDKDGKFSVKNVDADEITAWKENVFLFKNIPLGEIAMRLGDWYRVEFRFENERLKKECLYCRLPRTSSLETILEALGRDGTIRFTYQNGIVTVY